MTKTQFKHTKTTSFFPLSTYYSLKQVLKELTFDQQNLHVFSTVALTNKLSEIYHFNLTNISSMEQKLFDNFYHVRTNIYLQAVLRKELINGNYKYKERFLHRLSSLVETYYVIAQLGLNQIKTKSKNPQDIEAIQLINKLLANQITKDHFFQKRALTKEDISQKLCHHKQLQKIIFYEIDYLNFVRMSFIHWLRDKGFHIEFRVPYHNKLPRTYEFWANIYQVVTNSPIIESTILDSEPPIIEKFALFNEGLLTNIDHQKNIEVIEFPSPNDFKHYYTTNNDLTFAIDFTNVSPIVDHGKEKFYEDEYSKFLYYIQFCKKVKGSVEIEYEHFVELITSGWIYTDSISGPKALALLKDLEEYMSGIKTINDIIERLKLLQNLELISRTFDHENATEAGRNNFKRYMLNPFRTFALLQRDRYEISIQQLLNLTYKLKSICQKLILEETETINVNEYFATWREFIKNSNYKYNEQIMDIFSTKQPNDWNFSTPELLSLIYFLMDQLQEDRTEIYPLSRTQEFMIDNDQIKSIHMTNLTLFNFPESHETPISEFFDHTTLKELVQLNITHQRTKNILLHSLWVDFIVHENFESLGIYHIHNVLTNFDGLIKVSWIDQINENSIRSIYLDILADLYTSGKINIYETNLDFPKLTSDELHYLENKQPFDTAILKNKIPDLYWLDHDFCAKKFFLTTFIEQQPIYDSDFHYNLVFSKIGKLLSFSKSERDIFRQIIYPLFPHWTYTKKENLIDMEYIISITDYKHFENVSYPRAIQGLQVLRSIYRENRRTRARNQYRRDNNYNETKLLNQFSEHLGTFNVKAEPGNHCKMCPHLPSCVEGMYSIDNINR